MYTPSTLANTPKTITVADAEGPKGGADAKRSVQQDQMQGDHQPNDRSGSVSGPGLADPFDEGRHAAKTAVRFMVGSAPRSHNHGNGHESLLPHKQRVRATSR